MNFEKLRDMEAFTQAMFDRIIAFQERDHAAWDPSKPFDQRIHDLPLHYLVFSMPDRDPATHGPTVAHYYPLRRELWTIAQYARQVADEPVVADIHARNGFVGSLLAREGLKVIGLDDPLALPNQIERFEDPGRYERRGQTLAQADFPFDVAFSSWMPSGEDITEALAARRPKLVVYVFTKHRHEDTDEPQTGTDFAFGEALPDSYRLLEEWSVTRPKDLFHEIWPDLTPSPEETRWVRIYADEGYHHLSVDPSRQPEEGYDWERELEMAELALAAKEHMRARGFPV